MWLYWLNVQTEEALQPKKAAVVAIKWHNFKWNRPKRVGGMNGVSSDQITTEIQREQKVSGVQS